MSIRAVFECVRIPQKNQTQIRVVFSSTIHHLRARSQSEFSFKLYRKTWELWIIGVCVLKRNNDVNNNPSDFYAWWESSHREHEVSAKPLWFAKTSYDLAPRKAWVSFFWDIRNVSKTTKRTAYEKERRHFRNIIHAPMGSVNWGCLKSTNSSLWNYYAFSYFSNAARIHVLWCSLMNPLLLPIMEHVSLQIWRLPYRSI